MSIRKDELEKCEKENYLSYAILPAIGILVFGGYYFFQHKKPSTEGTDDREADEKPKNSNLENFL